MVSFKFNTSRVANFTTDIPSKHGFQLKDLNRICVYLHYYDKEQNPFYVGQGSVRRAFSFTSRNKLWKEKVIDITKVKVNIFKIDITIEESIKLEKELINKYKRIENGGCLVNGNDGNKYEFNSLSIPILQIDILGNIIKEWASATEASEKGNFHAGPIIACCKGKRHIHNGYQWIYKKDYNPNKNYEYIPGKTNNKIYIAISVAHIDRKPVNIKILYGAEDLRINGFTPKNVSQVITGAKKSHAGYIFLDFFKLHKEEKEKYINLIDITTKI